MANFKKHLAVGAIIGTAAGAGIYLTQYFQDKQENPETKFQWNNLIQLSIAGFAMGAITGISADIFEPALNPNHRSFFHSYTIWILAGLMVYKVLSDNNDKIFKNLTMIGFAGYSSHLYLDSLTSKSLPLIL
jgi:membrane-bound metal-dependent hydrolase YbcI (DUF457 family)